MTPTSATSSPARGAISRETGRPKGWSSTRTSGRSTNWLIRPSRNAAPARMAKCTVGTNELNIPTQKPTARVTVENTTARPAERTMSINAIT